MDVRGTYVQGDAARVYFGDLHDCRRGPLLRADWGRVRRDARLRDWLSRWMDLCEFGLRRWAPGLHAGNLRHGRRRTVLRPSRGRLWGHVGLSDGLSTARMGVSG